MEQHRELVGWVIESSVSRYRAYQSGTPRGQFADLVIISGRQTILGIIVELSMAPTVAPYALTGGGHEQFDSALHPEITAFSQQEMLIVPLAYESASQWVYHVPLQAVALGSAIVCLSAGVAALATGYERWIAQLCRYAPSPDRAGSCVQHIIMQLYKDGCIDRSTVLAMVHTFAQAQSLPLVHVRSFLQELESRLH